MSLFLYFNKPKEGRQLFLFQTFSDFKAIFEMKQCLLAKNVVSFFISF